ncbi:MAG: hypothetical protein FJ241_06035 [Nitrospira sp.]|nr:hypothetical protein [Nitrospira sp.]
MHKKVSLIVIAALLLTGSHFTVWAFESGSTGADGPFNPSINTEFQLPPDGIFNFTTVNIPSGVTVTFIKNASNTPVYVLATGDVIIDGTINVNGSGGNGLYPGTGGPGGFNGGLGGTFNLIGGKGLGHGGGNPGSVSTDPATYASGAGGGGGFGSNGSDGYGSDFGPGGTGGGTYGNTKIMPAIGGSGGGGGAGSGYPLYPDQGGGGGGGGGAIIIASSGTITVNGSITANGGNGAYGFQFSGGGGGSGGAIKLIANTITGYGTILATGPIGGGGGNQGGAGGNGRICLEANTITGTFSTNPPYTYGYPGTVFVTNPPTLKITSVGGINIPENPSGTYGSPDVTLPSSTTNPVTVNISATNIPVGTIVTVTSNPEYGTSTNATGALSGTNESSTASAQINLSTEYQCILTATATFTIQHAMYWDGEKIEKVRVATKMGGRSEAVYITKSGKEIRAELMAGLMK